MKVLKELPPDWIMKGCLDKFRIDVNRTYWTYGDMIYNPGGMPIPDDIVAHEETHMRQQAEYAGAGEPGPSTHGKDAWWREFLANPRFRLEQEAEAYGEQYRYFCNERKDRNRRAIFLHQISSTLSGPLYQIAVTQPQAKSMIEILSGQKPMQKQPWANQGV